LRVDWHSLMRASTRRITAVSISASIAISVARL
jgi:hypothetical protein